VISREGAEPHARVIRGVSFAIRLRVTGVVGARQANDHRINEERQFGEEI